MPVDRYGLSLTTHSQDACQAYVEGVDLLLSANPGARTAFERALAADPAFALARAGLARVLQMESRPEEAKLTIAQARTMSAELGARERGHVEALAVLIEGDAAAALAAVKEHLAQYPRDAMVLAPCTGVFGLIGFSGRAGRERELASLLENYADAYGDDWWFLSMHAFAQCEIGAVDVARRAVERSLEQCPRSAHAAHVLVHVFYESGEDVAGLAYIEDWIGNYSRDGSLHCHLSWHVALWLLQFGKPEKAREVYLRDVHPGASWGPPINTLTDAASFLWRAELAGGAPDAALWRAVRDYAQRAFPKAGIAFADIHSAIAYAATDDSGALGTLLEQMNERLANGRLAAGNIVPSLAASFGLFARGEWDAAIERIAPHLAEHERIGGSRAQRDLVEYTLLAACLRSGRGADARSVLHGRRAGRAATAVPVRT